MNQLFITMLLSIAPLATYASMIPIELEPSLLGRIGLEELELDTPMNCPNPPKE